MPHSQQLETHIARYAFVLDQIEQAIAVFDAEGQLVLYNQPLEQMLGGSRLDTKPDRDRVLEALVGHDRQKKKELALALDRGNGELILCDCNSDNDLWQCKIKTTPEGGRVLSVLPLAKAPNPEVEVACSQEVRRLSFLLGLTERLQPATDNLREIGEFALSYLVESTGAAFGDIKVITGEGSDRRAGILTNQVSSEFIATYGDTCQGMEAVLEQGIPYGKGLLWQVVETGEALLVSDYRSHPQAVPEFCYPGITEVGIFPIPGTNGSIIGVVTLESRAESRIRDFLQRDMLLAACRTLGVAIARARVQHNLRQANEELVRVSQMKSEFLASMSHELRTPLNSILGFSDLLQRRRDEPLSPRQLRQVQAIRRSGKHLLELINDILDLSKIEAGKTELDLVWLSVASLCRKCLRTIQPQAERKRHRLNLAIDTAPPQALLDERRVNQILMNLLSNAVKFTPDGGTIELEARLAAGSELARSSRPDRSPVNPETPYLCLSVSDTGIGIPLQKQSLLFRPFQQLDSSLTRQHEGTGLGLVLTKRLAELHGGTVSLESAENRGTTIRVWLPQREMQPSAIASDDSDEEETPSLLQPSAADSSDRPRLLVVEDHPFSQAMMAEVLEMEGYAVEVIYDGATMLQLIQSPLPSSRFLPNGILLDIQLPQVDGFQILQALRHSESWQHVPTIVVTAMAMPGDRDRVLAAGADDYLAKPIDYEALSAKVRARVPLNSRT